MGSDWQPWPALNRKNNHVWVKILALVLLAGVAFRLFFSSFHLGLPLPVYVHRAFLGNGPPSTVDYSEPNPAKGLDISEIIPKIVSDAEKDFEEVSNSTETEKTPKEKNVEEISQQGKCDIFKGEWVRNPVGPAYTNETCRFIEPPQNCLTNGRPDRDYLFWRWKPDGCDLPSFNAEKFLDSMRHKSWALIGDSILRNHVQSLICLLSKKEEPIEVYHDETFKSRRWHFLSYNLTLNLVWTPFLIKADIFENDDGFSSSELELHLDTLDKNWTVQYKNFDYVVISTGQWFLKTAIYWENGTVIGCHYCHSKKNLTEVGFDYAFRKTLEGVFKFIASSVHKPMVFYRTWTPDHFENGEWWSGGTCNRTKPYKKGEYKGKDIGRLMRQIEIEEFNRAVEQIGPHTKFLDTFEMSLLRPDGHSGPFRMFHPFDQKSRVQNDCLHWCLPGTIDSWNDLMLHMLMNN